MAQPIRMVFLDKQGRTVKFWEIWTPYAFGGAYEVRVRFGKIGTAGQYSLHQEATLVKAQQYFHNKISEKRKKGYLPEAGPPHLSFVERLLYDLAKKVKYDGSYSTCEVADAIKVAADFLKSRNAPL